MNDKLLSRIFNLDKEGSPLPNSWELSLYLKAEHTEIVGILNSLESKEYIQFKKMKEEKFVLTDEGTFL